MEIRDFLTAEAVLELREPDKRRVLTEMARRSAAMLDLDAEPILKAVTRREELGSTGLGGGIAIPHARLTELKQPFGLFALVRPGVQFDAIDERPVDLVFLLLLPDVLPQGQMTPLACVARRLRDPALAGKLRHGRGSLSLYSILTGV